MNRISDPQIHSYETAGKGLSRPFPVLHESEVLTTDYHVSLRYDYRVPDVLA